MESERVLRELRAIKFTLCAVLLLQLVGFAGAFPYILNVFAGLGAFIIDNPLDTLSLVATVVAFLFAMLLAFPVARRCWLWIQGEYDRERLASPPGHRRMAALDLTRIALAISIVAYPLLAWVLLLKLNTAIINVIRVAIEKG